MIGLMLLLACQGQPKTGADSGAPPATATSSPGTTPVGSPTTSGTGTPTGTGTSTGTGTPTGTGTGTPTGSTSGTDTGDTGASSTPPPPMWLDASGSVTCAAPERRDAARADRVELDTVSLPEFGRNLIGSGLAVADLDGDGVPELLVAQPEDVAVLHRDGDAWVADAPLPYADTIGLSTADADGDGDLDVVLARWLQPDVLLLNDGSGTLTATVSGLEALAHRSVSTSWADLDGDGVLDLAVAVYADTPLYMEPLSGLDPNALWHGRGDGTFDDWSDRLPDSVQAAFSFHAPWHDLDRDGTPELLIVNDYPWHAPGQLLVWDGDRFVEDPTSLYATHPIDGMGTLIADLDGDGTPDIAHSSFGALPFLPGTASPDATTGWSWPIDASVSLGLHPDIATHGRWIGWGMEAVDLDNDTDLDLPVVYGSWSQTPTNGPFDDGALQRDAMFLQEDGAFIDVVLDPAWAWEDFGHGRALVATDLNGDGWMDLVKRQLDGPTVVWTARCGTHAWLTVEVRDSASANSRGIGTHIEVQTGDGVQQRVIHAGSSSLMSGGPPLAHIGLADADLATVTVTLPDGSQATFSDVATRQRLVIRR
ncbi:MAG: hypothetical protein ACI9K2_004958 [Myxococcota bacterium]|jgi:hypothetical protein